MLGYKIIKVNIVDFKYMVIVIVYVYIFILMWFIVKINRI